MSDRVVSTSFARAGLLGNPSDGYHGKAIAISVRDFRAAVTLRPAARLVIQPSANDRNEDFPSRRAFVQHLHRYGFYGGVRLIKAAMLCFYRYCANRYPLHDGNFSVTWETSIPRSVGLAGSSAIITATLKSLRDFYGVDVSDPVLASLALSAEKDFLGISAGLMDRVVQAMQGVIFMDFSVDAMREDQGLPTGHYERLPASPCLDRLYLAWTAAAAEPTEVLHGRLQDRFARGDREVVAAMQQFAALAEQGRAALAAGDHEQLAQLIDANFDLRASICSLPQLHRQMVTRAREAGGSAKFCGSGGAIIGTVPDESAFESVAAAMSAMGCQTIRPAIFG
jgi:glucuronokinase